MTEAVKDDYTHLQHLFTGGDISKASKSDLERYAVMLSRPHASSHFNSASFPQVCETVRTLILVRISEEANREASIISKIALGVAVASLIVSIIALFSTQSVGILLRQ